MKRFLLVSLSILALSACGNEPPASKTETQNAAAATAKPDATPNGAELGDWGIETQHMKPAIKAGDNFYQHINGKWIDDFTIPEEFSSYGSFTVLFERSEERVRTIIEQAAQNASKAGGDKTAQKIGDFYNAYLDTNTIEAAGLTPLASDLKAINAITTHEDAARMMGAPDYGAKSIIGAYVNVDAKQPDRYILYMTQGGLGLPNRDYYLEEKFADKARQYQDYIAQVLSLAEITGAQEKAAAIYALEKQIATLHWEPAKRRNRDLTYNLKSKQDLIEFAPGLSWEVFFKAGGLGDQDAFVVREDDAIAAMAGLFAETSLDLWKDYFIFHLISDHADVLPKAFDDAHFAFYRTALRGTPKQRARWKRGVAAVNSALGEAVGKIYVEKHFPQSSKAQMEELVANLRRALDERLDVLEWMSEETKKEAHAKLKKFTPKIGYPDKWKDYSALSVSPADAYGNKRRAAIWSWNHEIAKLVGPIDPTEWFMTPQTVNAYYSPTRNEIVFPAAILQAPFFDPKADPAVNYGGIGAVIGHEIGHGFDDQGRKSDGDGILRDWWTDEDAENFQKLADRLGAQYETYEPIKGFNLNPRLTMGENIGDLGGLSMAYRAYRLSLGGKEAPVIDGLTGDQRFFMAWAQVWKRAVRDEQLKNQIASGPHSPARYRVNGVVRNMDAWYDAFGVEEGDTLYLAPQDRVSIW